MDFATFYRLRQQKKQEIGKNNLYNNLQAGKHLDSSILKLSDKIKQAFNYKDSRDY